jgi:hypothetical protein
MEYYYLAQVWLHQPEVPVTLIVIPS